ncbi:MAG: type II toxin-antitoxin system VapC family toxin [Microcoleus sp. PH2017_22_RUC_O_B]|uniref:type II toxin-antitoxin system VapC family toxin n=1 Tax=unclassified Microcoleus TaxID=2642155 RepID=UPI001E0C3DF4|nr:MULTISPECIES: type II toxin-antitoxin system VapC family toxin [unclassified Microcoleus]MCC3527963.1 type II toxin-antitoxin system VapC family toxin [Microcoleus sp. PH2017_21_RUC_O_A]MCC3539943.1 type II toxin-antitoxin system VapC family toxin [Microcoleus sp. PH2017_22_RUC_O_B]
MRLLLDTHTFIWYVTDNPRLSANVKLLIEDENNEKLVSIASIWEMAIKHSIGRLNFSLPFMEFVRQQLSVSNIGLLEINLNHIEVVASLPLHHRDPFDRLIIAQSMGEQIPVLSVDAIFDAYAIARLW